MRIKGKDDKLGQDELLTISTSIANLLRQIVTDICDKFLEETKIAVSEQDKAHILLCTISMIFSLEYYNSDTSDLDFKSYKKEIISIIDNYMKMINELYKEKSICIAKKQKLN